MFIEQLKNAAKAVFKPAAEPAKIETVWENDTVLKQLVDDYREGRTQWVFACDLAELYDSMHSDRKWIGLPIKVHVSSRLNQWLRDLIETTEAVDASDYSHKKCIGPNDFKGMRLTYGNEKAVMSYHYYVTGSKFEFTLADGRDAVYQCGINAGSVLSLFSRQNLPESPAPE